MSNLKPHEKVIFASIPLVRAFVNEPAAIVYECQNPDTSGVDLTFATAWPLTRDAAAREGMRMSESDH
jgi:hypothetical protein